MNWNEAKEYCTSNGGYLTDILDQETQDFIAETSGNFPGITWWIGGNDFDYVIVYFMYLLLQFCFNANTLAKCILIPHKHGFEITLWI